MKKANLLNILVLAAVLAGSVACSSKPKQAEAEPVMTDVSAMNQIEEAPETISEPSLGASSSGRGH